MRRKIYIEERLPANAAELNSVTLERKALLAKREQATPDERKQTNYRLNFLSERLEVLRLERSSLINERDNILNTRAGSS